MLSGSRNSSLLTGVVSLNLPLTYQKVASVSNVGAAEIVVDLSAYTFDEYSIIIKDFQFDVNTALAMQVNNITTGDYTNFYNTTVSAWSGGALNRVIISCSDTLTNTSLAELRVDLQNCQKGLTGRSTYFGGVSTATIGETIFKIPTSILNTPLTSLRIYPETASTGTSGTVEVYGAYHNEVVY